MRLDPKYFIPFLLIVAACCIAAIVFFNFRFIGGQQERFARSIGDGQALIEHEFTAYFTDETITLNKHTDKRKMVVFWASWADRSIEARDYLFQVISQTNTNTLLVLASVKDDEEYLKELQPLINEQIILIKATDFYNDARVPGIPGVIALNEDNSVHGMKIGFRSNEDYQFILEWLEKETK